MERKESREVAVKIIRKGRENTTRPEREKHSEK
jgi:hypothetical protein